MMVSALALGSAAAAANAGASETNEDSRSGSTVRKGCPRRSSRSAVCQKRRIMRQACGMSVAVWMAYWSRVGALPREGHPKMSIKTLMPIGTR